VLIRRTHELPILMSLERGMAVSDAGS